MNSSPILFDEVCHACGGCALLCPAGAIGEKAKSVGEVFSGRAGNVTVHSGSLKIGEASGIPIIKQLMKKIRGRGPPHSSTARREALHTLEVNQSADFCLLVAEPTVFWAHNLAMVFELAVAGSRGVVLNKRLGVKTRQKRFAGNGLLILGRICLIMSWACATRGESRRTEKRQVPNAFADLLEIWRGGA